MKRVIRLAVLSAMSAVTVLIPLDTTLADMAWYHSNHISKEIDDMIRYKIKQTDDMMREMRRKAGLSSHSFSSYSPHSKYHSSFDEPYHHHYIDHKRTDHHHHHHHHHHHVERKTYKYVERKTTKHSNIHTNNSGDALAAGILGLAAGAILGNVLKQPKQPTIVYQTAPQNQVIYEVQSTYQPLQQSQISDWLKYCKKKYRSFNPKTGTFRGYDGAEHFCYAPVN
ncbi:hypothetical protein MCO_01427 [Bartonella sp. DB5-6]|uniref:BA14K family protein n=1 Tax=Bartonella sp. DB5-6 TaxID=1094755 RepID=UPI00026E8FC2|nr:BA14K family protein [Bartonella sp. DB5-6]EJF77248.1 hypothetical protein MCO_01427 [Bartonella sp. DB5-6]